MPNCDALIGGAQYVTPLDRQPATLLRIEIPLLRIKVSLRRIEVSSRRIKVREITGQARESRRDRCPRFPKQS